MQLLDTDLTGPSPKLMTGELGILDLDHGRYESTCGGVVPKRVQEYIESEGGLGGTALLAHFGEPPYGYTPNVVKACVAGLLRANKVRIQPEDPEITAVRDAAYATSSKRPASVAPISPPARTTSVISQASICKFFKQHLGLTSIGRTTPSPMRWPPVPGPGPTLRGVSQLNRSRCQAPLPPWPPGRLGAVHPLSARPAHGATG
jgi:hypothetical protein